MSDVTPDRDLHPGDWVRVQVDTWAPVHEGLLIRPCHIDRHVWKLKNRELAKAVIEPKPGWKVLIDGQVREYLATAITLIRRIKGDHNAGG